MESDELMTRLRQTTSFDSMGGLYRPLLRLLADGRPASVEDLAATAGRPVDDIRQTVASLPYVERDDQGRIVGSGLTLRETPHHFEVEGKRLYTWCALDTLVFPALLGRSARIESPCHGTGTPIRITVEPTGVTGVDPETAVVSIVTPGEKASVRHAFCDHVHFFASPQAAQGWLDDHPAGTVHAVAEAFRLRQPLVETLLEQRPADPGVLQVTDMATHRRSRPLGSPQERGPCWPFSPVGAESALRGHCG